MGSPSVHPGKTRRRFPFLFQLSEPVAEFMDIHAFGGTEIFLGLAAPGEFLHQEDHFFSFHSFCFYAKLWAVIPENMYFVGRILRKSYEVFSVLLYPGNVWGRIGNVKMYLLPGLTVKQSHVFTRTFRQKTLTRTGEMKSTRYHPKTKNGQF